MVPLKNKDVGPTRVVHTRCMESSLLVMLSSMSVCVRRRGRVEIGRFFRERRRLFHFPFLPRKHSYVKLKLTLHLTSTPMSCWNLKIKNKKIRWESVNAPRGGRRMRPPRFLWFRWRFVFGIACFFCGRTACFPRPRPLPASSTCLHSAPMASPATSSSFLLNAVTDGPVLYLLSAMQLS